jgi:hypothetical protein
MIAETIPTTRQQPATRALQVEFLFLDLQTCTRCVGTDANLETAIETVQQVLSATGIALNVEKILIDSPEKAHQHHFVTSPTIRVNGRDIALETRESRCDSCSDLCGCEEGTDCRVWVYRGQEYTEAPVGMIVEALLQEIAHPLPPADAEVAASREVPENIAQFLAARATQVQASAAQGAASCCSAAEQQTCCEPSAKASCCGASAVANGCGCR